MAGNMKTIRLTGKRQVDYATKLINECLDKDELWCVDIKKHKEAKTLQQLRALFGTWYDYLSNELGYTKDELHNMHKYGFDGSGLGSHDYGWLLGIYLENPQGEIQEMWAEHFNNLFEKNTKPPFSKKAGKDLVTHCKRASLKWATIDQMREYMTRIEHYYMNAGYPLPILEKFKRWYT